MVLPVRTGYEQVVANRVGDGFASMASDDGIVESMTETGMVVAYKNGTKQGMLLGTRFGAAAGATIPHDLTTELKIGDRFKAGDALAYHKGWFTPDYFNKGQLIYKGGVLATIALVETPQTHEDACTLTTSFVQKLRTDLAKPKKVRMNFKDDISNVVAIGARVEFETPLCLIQDEMTANTGVFSQDTIATLAMASRDVPTAKTTGVVTKIEVFYNGSKEDMSLSVRALANYGDKQRAKQAESTGGKVYTGSTDESYRVDGDPLLLDTMCVVFYIKESVPAGVADKVVFANQMKSVISEVVDYKIVTESGIEVDGLFGAYSIFKRIVNSAFNTGTTNVLSELGARQALKIYRGK